MFDDEAAVDLGRDPDDLEILIEGNIEDNEQDGNAENGNNNEDNQANPEGTDEKPKKRVVKRPQPKLDPERLRGPRGIATLEGVFKDFKFHGKGHEKQDLNRMMKQLEHWAHRLYPRFQFDDCLEKIEKLGHKKAVGTLVKRIRMGLETGDDLVLRANEDEDNDSAVQLPDLDANVTESPLDDFDALLSQQLSEARARTPMLLPPQQSSQSPQVISEEQRERMLRNRQLAEERRLARLKSQQNQISGDGHLSQQQAIVINAADEQVAERASQQCVNSGESLGQTSQLCQESHSEPLSVNLKNSSQHCIEETGNADVDKVVAGGCATDMNNPSSEFAVLEEQADISSKSVPAGCDYENLSGTQAHLEVNNDPLIEVGATDSMNTGKLDTTMLVEEVDQSAFKVNENKTVSPSLEKDGRQLEEMDLDYRNV